MGEPILKSSIEILSLGQWATLKVDPSTTLTPLDVAKQST